METGYLSGILKEFNYYKLLGEKAMDQLDDESIFLQINDESNSIAIIISHLSGNMVSRFTEFLTSDGEKPWRNRDAEFENTISDRTSLVSAWEKGWRCLLDALENLSEDELENIVYIRNEGHTVNEAIIRQLAHYSYHIGQIVFIAKMLKNKEWKSLTIPRKASSQYNERKFEQIKGRRHFTDNS